MLPGEGPFRKALVIDTWGGCCTNQKKEEKRKKAIMLTVSSAPGVHEIWEIIVLG